MSSAVGDKRNVKIFVLYLLENINYPMELCTISDIVMQTDYVLFLDFAESFNEMVDAGLLETVTEGDTVKYVVSAQGKIVAQTLKSDVLPSMLDKALNAALRYLDFSRRGVIAECEITGNDPETGECIVHCRILEKKKILLDTTLRVDSTDRAIRMKQNFESKPDVIYRGYTALLSGNVNYLFN